ncbi:MAG TPA: hypothetical protein P5069_08235, partial [Candidatus Hydrogenedentes bacterium]|nr:hypothetical protein [Candidatus Hydrogenedentota bacterium]
LFLAGIARSEAEQKEIERLYAPILGGEESAVGEEMVLQSSMRGYPALLLADEDAWMDIQKDTESNLALSPEETKVLESVHRNEGGFPIFINGRAGSGKSTILYYLFADYVSLYLELREAGEEIGQPVMFSCSDDLRRRAQETVTNLLSCNPRWRKENEEKTNAPQDCFQEFKSFLYSFLTPEEKREVFPPEGYVDYSVFRQLWQDQFGREKKMRAYGADLSWHVIRTYIKGTSSEDYLEPEDYTDLPKKQKSVTQDTYDTVYRSVWEGWYRALCERGNYWDDQDLARHLFDTDRIQPVYPAIFCDEAQDFTRIELDLLFRLCLFSDRKLAHTDIARVPYAFAGDPFQTLNPTGFRWDAIQASFHEKLMDILGKNIHHNIDLNYQELNLNYRSTQNIVRLCNLIQALRAALFNLPTLQPQHTWQTEQSSPMPVWFDRDKTGDWDQIGSEADVITIVPCMLNEERDYVDSDAALKRVVKRDDSGVPLNVLSPIRAKGLEFSRVVLYGFAERLPEDISQLLDKEDVQADALLPIEYFINQLYVAASRPKRRLFIIDTQKDRERLWKIANDETLQQKIWRRLPKEAGAWKEHIGGFTPGTADSWREDRGNPEENAERMMQQGESSRDTFLLRSAAIAYENLNKPQKAQWCRGKALEWEGLYLEAGEAFQKAGEAAMALDCFWKAGTPARDVVLQLHAANPDLGGRIECRLFTALDTRSIIQITDLTAELAKDGGSDADFKNRLLTQKGFEEVVREYGVIMVQAKPGRELALRFLAALDALSALGLPVDYGSAGQLCFQLGDYARAVAYWDHLKDRERISDYREAKSILLSRAFEKDPSIPLTPEDAKILYERFLKAEKYLLAVVSLRNTGSTAKILDLLGRLPRGHADWKKVLIEVMRVLASDNNWRAILELGLASQGMKNADRAARIGDALKPHADTVRNAIVDICVTHPEFTRQNTPLLREFADFFSATLVNPDSWRRQITVQAVGAAMERTGRLSNSHRLYERILHEPGLGENEKHFVIRRLVAVKERLAVYESGLRNESQARSYMTDAGALRREFGLGEAKFPEFPEVDAVWVSERRGRLTKGKGGTASLPPIAPRPGVSAVDAAAASAPGADEETGGPVSCVLGQFKLECSKEKFRINITHMETMHTASILADSRDMKSVDVVVRNEEGVQICDDWNMACTFEQNDGLLRTTVTLRDSAVSMSFDFETGPGAGGV